MSFDQRLNEHTRNHLIALVKDHPILYQDDRSPEGKDERNRIWDAIGQQLSLSGMNTWMCHYHCFSQYKCVFFFVCLGDVCKAKFTNLKNNYFKGLRNESISDEMRRRLNFLDDVWWYQLILLFTLILSNNLSEFYIFVSLCVLFCAIFFSRSFRFHFRSSRLFATQCLFPLKKNNINFPNPMKKLAPWNKVQNEKPARITQRRATKRRPDYNE